MRGRGLGLVESLGRRGHPEDAVPIYLKQAEVAVTTARKSVYDNAVELLVKAAALMKRMGRSEEFVRQLESIRLKYKIKRNFVKRLEQRRKSLYLAITLAPLRHGEAQFRTLAQPAFLATWGEMGV